MKKILLIEDDPDQIFLYSTQFKLENLELLVAQTGKEGLEKIKKEIPDLILLDILLSDINGIEILKKIKEDSTTKKIPVILLTNLIKKELIDKGKKYGALDFWLKTEIMPKEIIKRVKKILKIN